MRVVRVIHIREGIDSAAILYVLDREECTKVYPGYVVEYLLASVAWGATVP